MTAQQNNKSNSNNNNKMTAAQRVQLRQQQALNKHIKNNNKPTKSKRSVYSPTKPKPNPFPSQREGFVRPTYTPKRVRARTFKANAIPSTNYGTRLSPSQKDAITKMRKAKEISQPQEEVNQQQVEEIVVDEFVVDEFVVDELVVDEFVADEFVADESDADIAAEETFDFSVNAWKRFERFDRDYEEEPISGRDFFFHILDIMRRPGNKMGFTQAQEMMKHELFPHQFPENPLNAE